MINLLFCTVLSQQTVPNDTELMNTLLIKARFSTTPEEVRSMHHAAPKFVDILPNSPKYRLDMPFGYGFFFRNGILSGIRLRTSSPPLRDALTDEQVLSRAKGFGASFPLRADETMTYKMGRRIVTNEPQQINIVRTAYGYKYQLSGYMLVNRSTGDIEMLLIPNEPFVDRQFVCRISEVEAKQLMLSHLTFQLGTGVHIDSIGAPRYFDPVALQCLEWPSSEFVKNYATVSEKQRAKEGKAFLLYKAMFSQWDGQRKGQIMVDAETSRVLFYSYRNL